MNSKIINKQMNRIINKNKRIKEVIDSLISKMNNKVVRKIKIKYSILQT